MRVLVACEFSGIVRDAFLAAGHDAVSCDLLPSERPGPHYQGDVRDILDGRVRWIGPEATTPTHSFDLLIAHPPCTYLSRAGARWWKRPGRAELAREAAAFVQVLWNAPIPRVAIENPIGMLNRLWRYPDQTVEPWQFGEPYTKRTCLWLRGLPPLLSTEIVEERTAWLPSNVGAGRRKGQRSQPGIAKNATAASRTFPGIAAAMAAQWGAAA
jgi:hypothetical protein